MKKIGNILFLYFFVFVMCMGASFAWYVWKGSEVGVDVNFAGLDSYIKYSPLTIKDSDKDKVLTESDDYTGGICYNLVFNKKANGDNLDLYGKNYLQVTSVTDSDIFKASNLKWTLFSVTNNIETEISTGNFVGENIVEDNDTSKMIPVSIDFPLTKASDNTSYEFCLWLDSNSYKNVNISGKNITVSIVPVANPVANTIDENGEMYIRSIEYGTGVIKKFVAYSSKYDISGYKIVNTETTPNYSDSDWITISSNEDATIESGKIVTIEPNYDMKEVNNICIKNTNNKVYCKSIGKYSDEVDKPTSELCNVLTYNGYKQQLVKSTSGVGYTLLNKNEYEQTNANLPNEQGYKITATLNDGYVWKDGTSGTASFYCKIAQKDLTITASDQTINYGDSISQIEYTYDKSELVGNDTIGNITLKASTAEVTTNGTITPSVSMILNDGEDVTSNYNIIYKTGNLIITYKEYGVTLDNQGATSAGTTKLYGIYKKGIYLDSSYNKLMTISANSITKPAKTGYTFGGYYKSATPIENDTPLINTSGYITSSFTNTLYRSNVTLYAKWNANALVFNDKTITKTYNMSDQSDTINSASNGTGTYTYSITSGNTNSYFSLSGTTLNIDRSTPVGKYTLKVLATDNNSKVTKEATITIKIDAYNLSNATIASVTSQAYTGNAITPTPAVTVPLPSGSTTILVNGTDFNYGYSNNVNAGTATVTVTGKGNYTGSKSINFTIISDTTEPTLLLKNSSSGNWVNSNITIELTFSDGESGINPSSLQYSTDNSNWTSISNTSTSKYTDTWYDERNSTVYYKICDNAGNCSTVSTMIKIDKTAPTLTLSHDDGVITITSDTNNIYSDYSPGHVTKNSSTDETKVTNVSSSEPGPVTDSVTWKLETSGSDNPQWIGWQGTYGNSFSGNANDIIIISGYYKSSELNGISDIIASTLYKSDWSSYSTTTIDENDENMIEDGQWHYFSQTFRVNESFSNAIIGWAPAIEYSTEKRTLYINGLNWRIVPSSNTTATDIHIRKWASGSQSVSYFKNGGGTQISGNSFKVTSSGTYTVYVEDAAGNGTVKTINSYSLSISKGTGVSTIYYKTGSGSYKSLTSNVSINVASGTTYSYYGTSSAGYSMSSCTESSPCSGTIETSNVSKSLSATLNTYTIVFNSNGGTGTMSDLAMTYGTAKTLTANSFKKQYTVTYNYDGATGGNSNSSATANYKFVGWTMGGVNLYSKLNLSNNSFTIDEDGMYYISKSNTTTSSQYFNFFFNTRDDIVSGKDYTEISVIKSLSYSGDDNYYVGDTPNASGTITQLSDSLSSINNLKVGNNYFSLKGTSITSPSLLSRGFIGLSAGASITIKFRPVLIAAKYNNIDMYFFDSSSVKNLTTTNGGKVNLYADWNETSITLPTPTKTGYTFAGWYTASSGGTKVGDGGDKYIPTSNVTLYARWNVNSYILSISKGTGVSTIYYKVNGASSYTSSTSNVSVSVNYGTTYYYYGSPSSGYYMTSCTSSSPCSGTMGTSAVSKSLSAYESVYYLYDSSGNLTGYANTLSNAISNVSTGGQIRASKANSSGAVTISKNVTINPNGWTITMTGAITNSANLTIEGSGTITNSSSDLIENTGTVTINGPTVRTYGSSHNSVVMKKGTVNLKVGIIQSDFYGITSSSSVSGTITVNITGGTITTNTSGAVSQWVNPVNIDGSSSYKSTINISGGTLTSKGYGLGVGTYATATITAGTIENYAYNSECASTIVNKGTLYLGTSSSTADSTNIKIYNSCGGSAVHNMSGSVSYYNSGYLYSGNSAGIYNSGTSNIRSGYAVDSVTDSTYGYKTYLSTITTINNYRTMQNETGTRDFLYITTCTSANCNYTSKNADSSSGTVVRDYLDTNTTPEGALAKIKTSNQCTTSSCLVYVFTKPGLNSSTASNSQIVGVLYVNKISTTYPVYKTSSLESTHRKIYFSYNTGANIIQSFTQSFYAYGSGTIQKISYNGDWYFAWISTDYIT